MGRANEQWVGGDQLEQGVLGKISYILRLHVSGTKDAN